MKTPELSVMHSETVATELAFDKLALAPSGEDLAALTDHLGLKVPDTLTAAVVYPGDHVLFPGTEAAEDPAKADVASVGMQDLSVFPEGTLAVAITKLSEQNILEGFARSLMPYVELKQRGRVLKWGTVALGVGTAVGLHYSNLSQGPELSWGLLGVTLAGSTIGMGGLWRWYCGWRDKPLVIPSLDGLESPVRIVRRTENQIEKGAS